MPRITMLYPSFNSGLVPGLEREFEAVLGPCHFTHLGESGILNDIRQSGSVTEGIRERLFALFDAAVKTVPDIIICTCSSIGAVAEQAQLRNPSVRIVRIDEGMVRAATARYSSIGVMGTLSTTMDPSTALVRRIAGEENKPVTILSQLATGAFEAQKAGDSAAARELVLEAAKNLGEQGAEVILLAQASMATMRDEIANTAKVDVLSSPPSAARWIRELL